MVSVINKFCSACPICATQSLSTVYTFDDFSVMRCRGCGNSWRTNMYTKDMIVQMYCEEDYDQHPYFAFEKKQTEQPSGDRFKSYERALKRIEAAIGTGRLLDVACGSGAFLAMAQRRGWHVEGVEISSALCRASQQLTNATIYNTSFEEADLRPGLYDAVTFWDIIEHVLDPVAFVEKARSLIRPGGVLLFCTPDEDSLLAKLAWIIYQTSGRTFSYPGLALHPRYHTFFFSRSSLAKLLKQRGMAIVGAYSQQAFFQHSPLASDLQKRAIGLIEKVAAPLDLRYECVVIARS